MNETPVMLVRHASTEASTSRRLLGRLDEPLSRQGIVEAEAVAHQLVNEGAADTTSGVNGRVISSPLLRARQTASRIADVLDWPLLLDAGLAERDFGSWAGCRLERLLAYEPRATEQFIRDPLCVDPIGAEDRSHFQTRVLESWSRVIGMTQNDITPIVVTHDGPMRIILRHLELHELADVPLYGLRAGQCVKLPPSGSRMREPKSGVFCGSGVPA